MFAWIPLFIFKNKLKKAEETKKKKVKGSNWIPMPSYESSRITDDHQQEINKIIREHLASVYKRLEKLEQPID